MGGDRHLSQICVAQDFHSAFVEAAGILRGHGSILHPLMSSRLMQRKFSEPNTYIDGLPSRDCQEELYDDVEVSEPTVVVSTWIVCVCGGGRWGVHTITVNCPQDKQFLQGHLLCMGLYVTHLTGDLSRKHHLATCSDQDGRG